MLSFRFLGHLDTFGVVAQLHKLQPHSWKPNPNCEETRHEKLPHKSLILRCHNAPSLANWGQDLPCHDRTVLEKWGSLKKLLERARHRIGTDPIMREIVDPVAPLGRVVVSVIEPGGFIQWHTDLGDYARAHVRFQVSLVTNPDCLLYVPGQAHLPVGALAFINAQRPHSAGNWGATWRSHLLFELRRRGPDDGEVA